MPRSILIDEIFVSLRAPPALPEAQYTARRRRLRFVKHFLGAATSLRRPAVVPGTGKEGSCPRAC